MFPCKLPKSEADALNQESARLYTRALVEHYRIYRQTGHWLSPAGLEKLVDFYDAQEGRERLLHAHSIDAAEQGFPKACKTARECRKLGLDTNYPHRRKYWRTTIWKNTGIKFQDGRLRLALAQGHAPVWVNVPPHLAHLPPEAFCEMRLVWDKASHRYNWHLVVDDGQPNAEPPGDRVMAGDLGEIHPIALTDETTATVISARVLRSTRQYTNKRLAEIQALQARKKKGSRQWKKLQCRKSRFLAQQKRRVRDIEHKVSRAAVDCAREQKVGTLALGDVRDVADGKRLNTKSQQKVSNWSHGKLRQYVTYKAEAAGIRVELVDEKYTTQTCPNCRERYKPQGRLYRCPVCGFASHREAVGAANILSRHRHGILGKVKPPVEIKYRHPCGRLSFRTGKRSRLDTAQVACDSVRSKTSPAPETQEAAPL
jgi:putative transposase